MEPVRLSITENYAPSWGTWEGVREMVQNWHDGALASFMRLPPTKGINSVRFEAYKHGHGELSHTCMYHARAGDRIVGSLSYVRETETLSGCYEEVSSTAGRLVMVNRRVSLNREILLLGFSQKARHTEVIGQFGEGMKVGILALLREGRRVSLSTRTECWEFRLDEDPSFGNKRVLSVFIEPRGEFVKEERLTSPSLETPLAECGSSTSGGTGFVLGVRPSIADEGSFEDTVTEISPISPDEWDMLRKRFLFLEPPALSVRTPIGTLLLDPAYLGRLYVKGVFIQDLSEEGLSSGVDFAALELDRDRRAVVKLSSLEHQLASIWIRAIELQPGLISHYYAMLSEPERSAMDVKHAAFYMTDRGVQMILDHFYSTHGDNAFPVALNSSRPMLRQLEAELDRRAVACNSALLEILRKSGRIPCFYELLSGHHLSRKEHVPPSSLTSEERQVVAHAAELVRVVYPHFSLALLDIVRFGTATQLAACSIGGRVEVSYALMDTDMVHSLGGGRCPVRGGDQAPLAGKRGTLVQERGTPLVGEGRLCLCREVRICHVALQELHAFGLARGTAGSAREGGEGKEGGGVDLSVDVEGVWKGGSTSPLSPLSPQTAIPVAVAELELLAVLAAQACAVNTPVYCAELSHGSTDGIGDGESEWGRERERAEMGRREAELRREVACAHEVAASAARSHLKELKSLQRDVRQLEELAYNSEADKVNLEQSLHDRWSSALGAERDRVRALEAEKVEQSRASAWAEQQLKVRDDQMRQMREAHLRKEEALQRELGKYRQVLVQRTEQLLRLCRKPDLPEDEARTQLLSAVDRLKEELEDERARQLCCICVGRKIDCVFLPCRHRCICDTCAETLRHCPLCRAVIDKRLKVFD